MSVRSRLGTAIPLATFAVGVTVGYALRPDSGAHVLPRSADEWTALATFAAVVLALWFGVREDKARGDELARLRDERDDLRRTAASEASRRATARRERQARDVVIWVSRHAVRVEGKWEPTMTVGFSNASAQPISSVDVILRTSKGREIGAFAMMVGSRASSPLFDFHAESMDEFPAEDDVLLEFRDGAGVSWQRSARGALIEIAAREPAKGIARPGHGYRFIGEHGNDPLEQPPGASIETGRGGPPEGAT